RAGAPAALTALPKVGGGNATGEGFSTLGTGCALPRSPVRVGPALPSVEAPPPPAGERSVTGGCAVEAGAGRGSPLGRGGDSAKGPTVVPPEASAGCCEEGTTADETTSAVRASLPDASEEGTADTCCHPAGQPSTLPPSGSCFAMPDA